MPMRSWCWMRRAFSRRAPSRPASTASTPVRLGASRIVRLACSSPMPAAMGMLSSIAPSTCPYLPQTWTDDPSRCRNAGIPDEVTFTTKPKIGRAMLERALAAHLPFAWVTGDSVYGADSALRRSIEAASKGYVLTVTSAQHLGLRPVGDWATEVPKGGWTRLSAGDGAKGPRLYDWACVPFRGAREGWQKALLIRRSLEKPDELTFYLTLAPEGTELATLVQVAGSRWTIEACFEAAKGEVGLDEYEVRSWTGWHRHVTLAMLAHAYLAVVRQHAIRG